MAILKLIHNNEKYPLQIIDDGIFEFKNKNISYELSNCEIGTGQYVLMNNGESCVLTRISRDSYQLNPAPVVDNSEDISEDGEISQEPIKAPTQEDVYIRPVYKVTPKTVFRKKNYISPKPVDCKIFHGIGVSNFKKRSRLWKEQQHTLDVLKNIEDDPCYKIVLFGDKNYVDEGDFELVRLNRTGKTDVPECTKNLPFLKDILNGISDLAEDDDWLMFSNVDCYPSEMVYKDLLNKDCDFVEYRRTNTIEVGKDRVALWGVDAFAIKKSLWVSLRDEFPELIIGALYWDQYLYTFVRYHKLSITVDVETFYHKDHEKTWDYYNPDPGDWYNINITNEFFEKIKLPYGAHPKYWTGPVNLHISMACKKPFYHDLTTILATWGNNDTTIANVNTCICNIAKQRQPTKIVLVELLFGNEKTSFPHLKNSRKFTHIIVRGNDTNKYIFQKEALWNIGAASVPDDEYMIFMDSDIWSEDTEWFYKIRNKLSRGDNVVVHGFNEVHDSLSIETPLSCYFRNKIFDLENESFGTGFIYGMSKYYYNDIGGFNPYAIVSNGDSLLMHEICSTVRDPMFDWYAGVEFKYWKSMVRDCPKCVPEYVDVNIIHENHGTLKNRRYAEKALIVHDLDKTPMDLLEVDDNGLMAWKNRAEDKQDIKKLCNVNREDYMSCPELHTKYVDIIFPEEVISSKELQCIGDENILFTNAPEVQAIDDILLDLNPTNILDIGAGIGRASVYLYKAYGWNDAKFTLYDGDSGDETVMGYNHQPGDNYYNRIKHTELFCEANGLKKFKAINAEEISMNNIQMLIDIYGQPKYDLIVSWLTLGFHWHIGPYLEKLANMTQKDGLCIFGMEGIDDDNPYYWKGENGVNRDEFVDDQVSKIDLDVWEIVRNERSTSHHRSSVLVIKKK
jgi:hypothetical protein